MFNLIFSKLCDLVAVYQEHFSDKRNDMVEIQCIDTGGITDEFIPFFYMNDGDIFMEKLFLENADKMLKVDSRTIVLEALYDYRELVKKVTRFYLGNNDFVFEDNDINYIKQIVPKIDELSLTYKVKCYLKTFLLDPANITKKLINNMIYIDSQINNLYENKALTVKELQQKFIDEDISIIMETRNMLFNDGCEVYCSFGILQPDLIKVYTYENYRLIYLGENYKNNMIVRIDDALGSLGKILSEPIRLKIMDLFLDRKELTIIDMNQILGCSGSTSYYHMTMMYKAGMLKIVDNKNNNGKQNYYSLNSEYFSEVICLLKKYMQ